MNAPAPDSPPVGRRGRSDVALLMWVAVKLVLLLLLLDATDTVVLYQNY